jgi:hypothetical protein
VLFSQVCREQSSKRTFVVRGQYRGVISTSACPVGGGASMPFREAPEVSKTWYTSVRVRPTEIEILRNPEVRFPARKAHLALQSLAEAHTPFISRLAHAKCHASE